MGINDIIIKINADAELEARQIIGHAKNESQTIIDTYNKQAQHDVEAAINSAKKTARQIRLESITPKRVFANGQILKAQQTLLNQVFADAFAALVASQHYPAMLKKLMPPKFDLAEAEITFTQNQPINPEEFFPGIKKNKTSLSLHIKDGFIIKTPYNEFPCSLYLHIDNLREKIEYAAAKILFGEAK